VRTTAALFSIIFAYCFQVVQVELMSEMHTPTDFRKTIFTTHAFIVVVYIAVAAIVYYLAGSEVPDPMTQIFDSTDPALGAVINAMLFVHASIALSINCTVFNQTVAAAVTNWSHRRTDTGTGNESGSDGDEKTRETLPITKYSDVGQNKPATPLPLPSFSEGEFPNRDSDDNGNITSAGSTLHASRGVWFGVSVATLVVAFVVSNSVVMFGDLVNIIGASFGMMTCYILPAVLVLLLLGKDTALLGTFERVFLWFVLGVAVPLSGLGMYATITLLSQNLGDSKNSPWQ
jgi:amino acid permease